MIDQSAGENATQVVHGWLPPTFSMPLTTEDLAATLDRLHHEDFEVQMREVERQRQEIERLQTALNEKK